MRCAHQPLPALHPVVELLESRQLCSTVAVLSGTTLFYVDSAAPTKALAKVTIRGLQKNDKLLGLDFQPSTGLLYALGKQSRLYLINPTSGQATDVQGGGLPMSPALAGTNFGLGFSPVSDLMRVVSDVDVNFRVFASTGFVIDYDENTAGIQTDLPLSYTESDSHFGANPNVTGIAYTRLSGGESTAFGVDTDADTLVRLGAVGGDVEPRDSGKLTTIGSLGFDTVSPVGFDVDTNGSTDIAYASLTADAKKSSTLYRINLSTGAATPVDVLKVSKKPVTDIAVVPDGHSIVALDSKNRLVTIDSNLPIVPTAKVQVSGLASKEKLVAIARRSGDGVLFGYTSQGRLYSINPSTGVATSTGEPTAVTLRKGSKTALDFDPDSGIARVVDNAGNSFRINPANGQIIDADPAIDGTQIDTPLIFSSTDVHATSRAKLAGLAFAGSPTTFFGIDPDKDALVTVGSPGGTTPASSGQVFTVGGLGVNAEGSTAFDSLRTGGNQVTFAAFKAKKGKMSLYQIDLSTGAATNVGWLASGLTPVGIVVLP